MTFLSYKLRLLGQVPAWKKLNFYIIVKEKSYLGRRRAPKDMTVGGFRSNILPNGTILD